MFTVVKFCAKHKRLQLRRYIANNDSARIIEQLISTGCQDKILIFIIDTDVPVRLLDRVGMFSRPVKFLPLPPPL